MSRRRAFMGLLVVLGSLWSAAAWAQQTVAGPGALAGRWEGEYVCNQGLTGLSLTIAEVESELRAVFVFYEAAANPGVPDGCFEMSGRFDPATGRLDFVAGRWIHRPRGYVTVDLVGVLDGSRGGYSGDVIGPNCGRFDLVRVTAPDRRTHACYDDLPVAGDEGGAHASRLAGRGRHQSLAAASSRR